MEVVGVFARGRDEGHNVRFMTAKLIRLRYAGSCSTCALALAVGTRAWWAAEARTTTCVGCHTLAEDAAQVIAPELVVDEATPAHPTPAPLPSGEAGALARQEYERRHQ